MTEYYVPDTFRRLWARLIDQLLTFIFYIPVIKPIYRLIFTDEEVGFPIALLILLALLPAIYEAIWLWLMQQTPGKWFMNLKVVDAFRSDKALSLQQCVLRAVVGRFDLLFSLAIFALAFFRYDRTHLADWMAETRVVQGTARVHRAKIRWFLGSLFVLFYGLQGMGQAAQVLKSSRVEGSIIYLKDLGNQAKSSFED